MTVTYLLAYFYTPHVFQFNVPVIDVPFIIVIKYVWPSKFVEIRL
jgi:hypothetical protein